MIPPSTHLNYHRGKNPPPTSNSVGAAIPTGGRLDCLHQLRYQADHRIARFLNQWLQSNHWCKKREHRHGLDWYNYSTGYEYIQQLRYIDNINLDAS